MSLKTESDQSNSGFGDEMQLDHSHGTKNKTETMTAKHEETESINIMNLSRDIFWIFEIISSNDVVVLFINTDFGRSVGVVIN